MLAHASSIIMSLIFIFVATKKRKKSSQVTTLGSLNSLAGGNRWKIVRPFGHSLVPLGCSQRLTPLLKECLSLANTILKRNPKRRATIMTKLFPLDFLSKWQTVNSSSSSSHSKWRCTSTPSWCAFSSIMSTEEGNLDCFFRLLNSQLTNCTSLSPLFFAC